MNKTFKFQHGRRVCTFVPDIRHATEIFRFEEAGQRIQLEKKTDGKWVAGRWSQMPDGTWDFIEWLRVQVTKAYKSRATRADPKALAKAAAARWVSTGE